MAARSFKNRWRLAAASIRQPSIDMPAENAYVVRELRTLANVKLEGECARSC